MTKLTTASVFVLTALAGPGGGYADVVVENLFLQCRVTNTESGGGSQTLFFDIANPSPQYLSHTAMHGLSYCDGGYDSQWFGDSATFDVTMDHRLQGFRGSVTSGGRWLVRPAVDSIVTFAGFFNYSHPTTPGILGTVTFNTYVRIEGTTNNLFTAGGNGGTFSLGPPAGTIPAIGSITLNAGTLYRIGYSFGTLNWDPPPASATWFGTGEVHIAINPVPEPVTLALFVMGLLFRSPRRR